MELIQNTAIICACASIILATVALLVLLPGYVKAKVAKHQQDVRLAAEHNDYKY